VRKLDGGAKRIVLCQTLVQFAFSIGGNCRVSQLGFCLKSQFILLPIILNVTYFFFLIGSISRIYLWS